jgi:hypothetical protein
MKIPSATRLRQIPRHARGGSHRYRDVLCAGWSAPIDHPAYWRPGEHADRGSGGLTYSEHLAGWRYCLSDAEGPREGSQVLYVRTAPWQYAPGRALHLPAFLLLGCRMVATHRPGPGALSPGPAGPSCQQLVCPVENNRDLGTLRLWPSGPSGVVCADRELQPQPPPAASRDAGGAGRRAAG